MSRHVSIIALMVALACSPCGVAAAQTTTYHLHNENSSTLGLLKLKTSGPDVTSVASLGRDLKGVSSADDSMGFFDTQAGVPGLGGIIPAGSTLTFTVWMKKSAALGTVFPRVSAGINWPDASSLCAATNGTTAISTTQAAYTVSCTTTSPVTMSTTDRLVVQIAYHMTAGPGNKSLKIELDIEGTLNGATDSRVVAPNPTPPAITSLSATSGMVGQALTITGTSFGATQGSSTVTFNGTAASVTGWGSTSVATTVPSGATTGPVVVTVGGQSSNGSAFTVIPPPTVSSLNPSSGGIGQAVTINGTGFGATQGTSTITFNGTTASATTWSGTSISVPVPTGATTGPVVVTVNTHASNSQTFTVLPTPTIGSLDPIGAAVGQGVTVTGTNFGTSQGSSTVTFSGTAAAATSWSATNIGVTVPSGAATGPVVVTVSGVPSNGAAFTVVTTGTLTGTITRVTGGSPLSGASIQAVLIGITKGSATSAADGTYSIPNLDPGTYDVRVLATGFSTEVRSGTSVSVNVPTTLNVAMLQPGSISGAVTQADGTTPISGAAVTLYSGSVQAGSVSTTGSGGYSMANLRPGAYTVQASAVGNRTKAQGATITENTNTTANLSMDPAGTGPVTYAYDELGRLVQVTDPSGESAIYRYDPVGNITAIERPGTSGVAISALIPDSGTVGTMVTITGTGFSTTPS
jgi:YD repeat-containing protein